MADEDIDFSDLEAKHAIVADSGFDAFVIVDGTPIVPQAKVGLLSKVLKKILTTAGPLAANQDAIHFPIDEETGKTKGFCFAEYASKSGANKAVTLLKRKRLDQNHTLLVNKFSDIGKYGPDTVDNTADYVAPVKPEFEKREHLKSWLADNQGRDQFVLHRGDNAAVFWNMKASEPELVEERNNWTDLYLRFSPNGTYLLSIHPRGVQIWAGKSWSLIHRFFHPAVKLVDFSPKENYLITLSNEPIKLPPEDHPNRASFPFSQQDEGKYVVLWDLQTGLPIRTFSLPAASIPGAKSSDNSQNAARSKKVPWPMFKWTSDEAYIARLNRGTGISVFDASKEFTLLDKKTIKIDGVMEFEWCPNSDVALEGITKKQNSNKDSPPQALLAYWTPEIDNQPARASVMSVPDKTVVRSRTIVNVHDCKLHWQSAGKYLCVKIDRHTKTKKSSFTSLEIFRITERAIPVDPIELPSTTVVNFAWEPNGDKFVLIANDPVAAASAASLITQQIAAGMAVQAGPPKTIIAFYGPNTPDNSSTSTSTTSNPALGSIEDQVLSASGNASVATAASLAGNNGASSIGGIPAADSAFKLLHTESKSTCNSIYWSPRGRFVVLAAVGISSSAGSISLYDTEFDTPPAPGRVIKVADVEHFGLTDVCWDPSGRYIASVTSFWRQSVETGYKLIDLRGAVLREEQIEGFKQLLWRPRPKSLLSAGSKREIRKKLRNYSRIFDTEDAEHENKAFAELVSERRRLLSEWRAWRNHVDEVTADSNVFKKTEADNTDEAVIEEIVETVISEHIEKV